jgi:hypothetical protein
MCGEREYEMTPEMKAFLEEHLIPKREVTAQDFIDAMRDITQSATRIV